MHSVSFTKTTNLFKPMLKRCELFAGQFFYVLFTGIIFLGL